MPRKRVPSALLRFKQTVGGVCLTTMSSIAVVGVTSFNDESGATNSTPICDERSAAVSSSAVKLAFHSLICLTSR